MRIETSLGNINLIISGKAKDGQAEKLAELAAASLTYRAGASKLFGKKAAHKRDEAYGPKLGDDAAAAIKLVLEPFFSGIEVAHSAYVKPENAAEKAAIEALRWAGVPEDKIAERYPAAKAEAAVEAAEASEENVG
jgi:hypothetical protein